MSKRQALTGGKLRRLVELFGEGGGGSGEEEGERRRGGEEACWRWWVYPCTYSVFGGAIVGRQPNFLF